MVRPHRGPGQFPFACGNCRWFAAPVESRPDGCRGQGVTAKTRPCAIRPRGFGLFEPVEIPAEVSVIDLSGITQPAALALLRWRVRLAEERARKALVSRIRIGDEVRDHEGRRGMVIRIGPRALRLHDGEIVWSVPSDLIEVPETR